MSEKKITRETTIGDVAVKFKDAVPPLLEMGMHCIGCPASALETIEQGARAHGLNDKEIDVLFLDGWDTGTHEYREKHLESFLVAKDKLADTHLILIDDTDFDIEGEGKDAFLSPYLLELGYKLLFDGRQKLYINII